MLTVKLNEDRFAYDIHSLVKAFYPKEEVKVFTAGEKELVSDGGLPELSVAFAPDSFSFAVRGPEKELCRSAALTGQEDRPEQKNVLKRLLYGVLREYTGRSLPWGSLTGIRPTRIAMTMLAAGAEPEQIRAHMQEAYYCSEPKASLAVRIAEKERRILSGLHYEDGYSLYIGIPFCPTTCLYCSFTSFPIAAWKKRVGEYLSALEQEIDYVAEAFQDKILDTLYIGGGTPTTLEPEELERLFGKLETALDLSGLQEFTVEAGRADSITQEKLRVMKAHGVTRISVNPQTMKEETLRLIGRRHTPQQVVEAFHMAREEGFTNINMDLILGLPGEKEEDVKDTLQAVQALGPDDLTVHSLAVKRGSRLHEAMLNRREFSLENTDATMEIAAAGAAAMGMEPYYLYRQKNMSGNFENVGYAKPGCAGLYNILMMEELQTIAALGAGSISKAVLPDGRIERCENVKDVGLYIEKTGEMIERKKKLFGL